MFIFSEASPLLLFNANAATSWPEAALQPIKKKRWIQTQMGTGAGQKQHAKGEHMQSTDWISEDFKHVY